MNRNSFDNNRIESVLHQCIREKKKALSLFITAGYPRLDSTVALTLECSQAGADIIEIGMPFSDPLADGPIIQESSRISLRNGTTLDIIFNQVKEIRVRSKIPLVLMGYLNPILRYGREKFFENARKGGIDGIILPEVPLEEADPYRAFTERYNLAMIQLVTPTTRSKRIEQIDRVTKGFLYCVSTTGVTGQTSATTVNTIERYIKRIKSQSKHPLLVGFGIKTTSDASRIARLADGVVIGSALIQRLAENLPVFNWIQDIKMAL